MATGLHTELHKKLIARLSACRKAAGLTQQQVADRLGKPQSYVAKVEGGERRLDVIEFMQLARAIGCDPKDVLDALQESGKTRPVRRKR